MTDTMDTTSTIPAMVSEYMLPQWKIFADKVAEIDEQLNTDGGRAALAKEAIAAYGEETAENVKSQITRLFEGLTAQEVFAVDSLIQSVRRSVASQVSKYVEDNKKEATELPDDQVAALREARKEAVNGANQLRSAVIVTNPQWAGTSATPTDELNEVFPAFENIRGAFGKRAPVKRLYGAWSWAVNGRAVPGNKVDDAAKVLGIPGKVLKESLEKYMTENGKEFDFKNPPEEFEFVHISGDPTDPEKQLQYTVSASRLSSDDEAEDDDEATFEEVDADADPFED